MTQKNRLAVHHINDSGGYMLLARELQNSLYLIARHAERETSESIKRISQLAEASLALIDSYMLASQVERGQTRLDLEPVSIGSVLHDSKYELMRLMPAIQPVMIQVDSDKPVMTHRGSLQTALVACGLTLAESAKKANMPVVFRGFRTRSGSSGVGVFVSELSLKTIDLDRALNTPGGSRMSLPSHLSGSGVALAVANTLCQTLGGSLQVKHLGNQSGLSTILPRSEQLSMV